MDYVMQQQQRKQQKESKIISKKYRVNLKTYQQSITVNNTKDESKQTADDYLTMIRFKHLFKDNMPPLPKTLQAQKERWQVVKYFPDPEEPVQPDCMYRRSNRLLKSAIMVQVMDLHQIW